MRHLVSTVKFLGDDLERAGVLLGIVGLARLPCSHPVVRRGLPAPAVRLVSCGPSSGTRRRPSRQKLVLPNTNTPLRGFASDSPKVHQ